MGAACCVAARDQSLQQGSSHDNRCVNRRSTRDSPSWSFRWDNRGRVAGEDTSPSWVSDRFSRSGTLDSKSMPDVSTHSSNTGGTMENDRTGAWCKSVMAEHPISVNTIPSASGQSPSTHISLEVGFSESPQPSETTITKLSPPTQSIPSLSTSPVSFFDMMHPLTPPPPPTATPRVPRWARQSLSQQSLSSSSLNSPTLMDEMRHPSYMASSPLTLTESSTRGSVEGRYSDNWSMHTFSELMSASLSFQDHHQQQQQQQRPSSFDFETVVLQSSNGGRRRRSVSSHLQTSCGVCSKLLSEKSAWSSQRITVGSNDLPVAAVLMCGHVYHADCLEHMTLEIDKYDPACPLCSLDEKRSRKELMRRGGRRSRKRVMDGDEGEETDDTSVHNRRRMMSSSRDGIEGKGGPKLRWSSSLKVGKPFLGRHLSLGSKESKSCPGGSSSSVSWKKGLLWGRSSSSSRGKEWSRVD